MATFLAWAKKTPIRRPFGEGPPEIRNPSTAIDPRLKQRAFDRIAILRELHSRLSKPRKPKTKAKVIRRFVSEFNSGVLSMPGVKVIKHISRSGLYAWERAYQKNKFSGLIPKYQTKFSKKDRAKFQPLAKPITLKFPGAPRRNGKGFFIERLRRRWKEPPIQDPIKMAIYYSMPIPKGIKMSLRMALLRGEISHALKPTLDDLDAFVMRCLLGLVIKEFSQIVSFHSEKNWAWEPETRVLIRPLKV